MNSSTAYSEFKIQGRRNMEAELERIFEGCPATSVRDASKYCVLGSGHRWRGLVTLAAGSIFSDDAARITLAGACSVEMVHSASMVLDDLPSMDDAEFRRGKPCVHHVFPGWAIDMVPGYLVTLAYQTTLESLLVADSLKVIAALEVSRAGLQMAQGQELDLLPDCKAEVSDEDSLLACYRLKSAALYAAAAKSGAVLCRANENEAQSLFECGCWIGLAYQFLDDVADVVAGVEDVGKRPGQDEGKKTAVALFGVHGARDRSQEFQERAVECLSSFGNRAQMMRHLAQSASWAPN